MATTYGEGSGRILLLAGEPSLVRILTRILKHEEQLELEAVESVDEALARLERERFTTLLVDERSTGVREESIRERLRSRRIRIAVVMVPHTLEVSQLIPRLHYIPAMPGLPEAAVESRPASPWPYTLALGGLAGLVSSALYFAGLDWRLGWVPIGAAMGALLPALRQAGAIVEDNPDELLEPFLLLFCVSGIVWLLGLSTGW